MAVDLLKGHFVCQDVAQKHHSGDPERQEVPSSLEDRVGVEVIQVGSLRPDISTTLENISFIAHLLRPAHGSEWPETRGEPSVQDIVVLVQRIRSPASSLLRLDLGVFE